MIRRRETKTKGTRYERMVRLHALLGKSEFGIEDITEGIVQELGYASRSAVFSAADWRIVTTRAKVSPDEDRGLKSKWVIRLVWKKEFWEVLKKKQLGPKRRAARKKRKRRISYPAIQESIVMRQEERCRAMIRNKDGRLHGMYLEPKKV